MATTSMLKASGLATFSNYLSSIKEGSLFEADNVVIDRDGIIEPRRGIKVNGDIPNVSKQLLSYKSRILAHYDNAIAFSNGLDPATFTVFKGKTDFKPINVDISTDTITINSHGLVDGDTVSFSSTVTLPAPITSSTTYYVKNATQNTFQITTTPVSAALNITTPGAGIHTITYDYVFNEVVSNLRIKYIEMNSNLYITTDTGIKKVYGLSQFNATTAGGFRALDLNLAIDLTNPVGFLPTDKEVAYRATWGTKDANANLIEGFPSYRAVIKNLTGSDRNVIVSFPIPQGITTDYFYRIYRTDYSVIDGSGDEHKLVYEAAYTGESVITVVDEQPQDLRDTGVPLYTNEFSGEGITQANSAPPVAKDVAIYKNTAFYANTRTVHKYDFSLLGLDDISKLDVVSVTGASPATVTTVSAHSLTTGDTIVIVGAGAADGTYPVVVTGANTFEISSVAATGTDTINVFTSSVVVQKDTIQNTYYFVGRPEITQVTYQNKASTMDGSYFLLNSTDAAIKYFVWFDKTGSTTEPSGADTVGRVPIRVDISAGGVSSASDVAALAKTALQNSGDFLVSDYTTNQLIKTVDSGYATAVSYPSGVVGLVSPFAAPTDISVTQKGFGQDTSKNYVRRSSLLSPAQAIESTAKSLVFCINNNSNDVIFAYYTPDVNELPGSMSLESKTTDSASFTIKANSATTGAMFNPDLTTVQTSSNEVHANRLYFSKKQQPEAVPLTNNIDIGPRDKAILRIIGLRDSLFVLKEEGVYRLTGDDFTNFSVALFDNSANIIAPDTACILNNQIYCLTSQGVATISETGVGIISRPIENIFTKVTSPSYTNYSTASFAFGYEADRAYILFTLDKPDDTVATRCYRYNTFTQSWTSWKKSATCGLVEAFTNKLYVGPPDINAIEVERKTLTSRDYADREYTRQVSAYNSGLMFIDNTSNMEAGDILMQTQYLTHYQYNRLVRKAKTDPILTFDPAFPEITSIGGDLRQKMIDLVSELSAVDTSLIVTSFNTATAVNTATDVITIASHGFENGDTIKLTSVTCPAPLLQDTYYFIVNATTNTFQLSNTIGGAAIDITSTGTGFVTIAEMYFTSGSVDFSEIQLDFNYNVAKLNASVGAYWSDYLTSTGTSNTDFLINNVIRSGNKVSVDNASMFFLGPFTHYKAIKTNVVWAPMAFQEPSLTKHIREGVLLLENVTLKNVTLGYATDLSGNFEDIDFILNGEGGWGDSVMGDVVWGGEGIAWPLRTLIPRQKQRCRYIKARFKHRNAMFKFSILGIAYTYEPTSERGYR